MAITYDHKLLLYLKQTRAMFTFDQWMILSIFSIIFGIKMFQNWSKLPENDGIGEMYRVASLFFFSISEHFLL